MKNFPYTHITSEILYKMFLENLYTEVRARLLHIETAYKPSNDQEILLNNLSSNREKISIYHELVTAIGELEKIAKALKSEKQAVDLTKDLEELKKKTESLNFKNSGQSKELENISQLLKYLAPGWDKEELAVKLKSRKFTKLKLEYLYQIAKGSEKYSLDSAKYYIMSTIKSFDFYEKYLAEEFDKSGSVEVKKEIDSAKEALEVFINFNQEMDKIYKISANGINEESIALRAEKLNAFYESLISKIEIWKKGIEETEEIKETKETKEAKTIPASESKKNPWYRRFANWVEKSIPFLGKFFNRLLDKIVGKVGLSQTIVPKKSQNTNIGETVENANNLGPSNAPFNKGKSTDNPNANSK